MWEGGIQWVLRSGVEGVVEVVEGGRGVVVMVRGDEVKCNRVLSTVMDKVIDVKTKCCHSLDTRIYYIHPDDMVGTESIPQFGELHMFDNTEVQGSLQRTGVVVEGGLAIPNSSLETINFWSESII